MHRAVFVSLAVAALGLGAGAVSNAQQVPARIDVTAVRLEGRTLTASVAVLDGASNPVTGLQASAFSAQVDGATMPITGLESGVNAALPLGLILTVDTSGSMAGAAMASAKEALVPVVTSLQAGDQAALITFAQTVTPVLALTADRAALSAAISAMQPAGNTALFAGISQAATAATQVSQPRRAVVVLSDGEDFGNASGGITREQALEAARASGAPFFVVGLGQEIDQQFLTALGRDTGGQYFAAATPAELAQLYRRISDRLRQQYTVTLQIPADLPAGDHRVAVSAGGASGQGTFNIAAGAVTRPTANFAGLPGELREPTTVRLSDAPAGATVRFQVDEQPVQPEADGRSLRLDPYAFEPGKPHTLTAAYDAADPTRVARGTFTVAALPPRLVEPGSLPNLRPGDLVRLTVQAQPGGARAAYSVNGVMMEEDTAPPYEFVLPEADYPGGDQELRVVLSNAAGETTQSYSFPGPEKDGANVAAYLLFGLLALGIVAAAAYGGRRAYRRYRDRPEPIDHDLANEQLTAWVQERRGGAIPDRPVPVVVEVAPVLPWGRLSVLEGPDAGRTYELKEDTELAGRGKFCTLRLGDKTIEEAHFLLSRGGVLNASTPSCIIEVDGEQVRGAQLAPGATIRAGATLMRYEATPTP